MAKKSSNAKNGLTSDGGAVESRSTDQRKTSARPQGPQGATDEQLAYIVQTRRTNSADNDEIMNAAAKMDGHIKVRIQPSIYDPRTKKYVALLGQQTRLKAASGKAVMELMDRLDEVLVGGSS